MAIRTAQPYLAHKCRAVFSRESNSALENPIYHDCIFIGYVSGGAASDLGGIYLCQCGLRWDAAKNFEPSTTKG